MITWFVNLTRSPFIVSYAFRVISFSSFVFFVRLKVSAGCSNLRVSGVKFSDTTIALKTVSMSLEVRSSRPKIK